MKQEGHKKHKGLSLSATKVIPALAVLLISAIGTSLLLESHAAPAPASAGYYQLTAPGTPFKSEATCAAEVKARNNPWEPHTENNTANHTLNPDPSLLGQDYDAWNDTWNSDYSTRISGNFSGTTDQIFQWAACKWGLSDNLIRAQAVQETGWVQSKTGDPEPADDGNCPFDVTTDPCNVSYGIMQIKWYFHPPGYYSDDEASSYPWIKTSTAFNVDEFAAILRGCYDGMSTYLGDTTGDIWGCVQSWYDGDWTPGGGSYATSVKNYYNAKPWLTWVDKSGTTGGTTDTTKPIVNLPTAPANAVSGKVTITPTATDNVGVTKIEIYIDGKIFATANASSTSSSWDTTKYANGSHTVQAKAYDAAGNVGSSTLITYTVNNVDTQDPTIPSNLTASLTSDNLVQLNWTKSTDNVAIASYNIYRSTNGDTAELITTVDAVDAANGYIDDTVAAGNSYDYSIQAIDTSDNFSDLSATVNITIDQPGNGDTELPTADITSPTSGQVISKPITIKGTATDNVAVTQVEFYVDGLLLAVLNQPNGTAASGYSVNWDPSDTQAGDHLITMLAYDEAGNVGESDVFVTINQTSTVNPPTSVTATANAYNKVTVKWNSSAGAAGYFILRSIPGGIPTTLNQVDANTLSYVDTTVKAKTSYVYYVEAFDTYVNTSQLSAPANVTTPAAPPTDTTKPTAPTGLAATAVSASQINLSWNRSTDNVGVVSYRIFRNNSTTAIATVPGTGTSAKVTWGNTGLAAGTAYSYTVRAVDAAGNVSPLSNTATATTTKVSKTGALAGTIMAANPNNPYSSCTTTPVLTVVTAAPAKGSVKYICTQKVQWFLNMYDNARLTINGWYDKNICVAVNRFKIRVGLTADCQFGAGAWDKLKTYGAPLAPGFGAQVITNYNGARHVVSAGAAGKYSFTAIPVGNHVFTYSLPNYTNQAPTINIIGGQTTTKNITLKHL